MPLSQEYLAELVASILPAVIQQQQQTQPQSHRLQSHQETLPNLTTSLADSSVSITKLFLYF